LLNASVAVGGAERHNVAASAACTSWVVR